MANKMKEYREKKGLSQEELAEISKTPVELIQAIEDGRVVSMLTFQAAAVAKALDVEPSKLFDAVGDSDAAATASEEKEDLNDK